MSYLRTDCDPRLQVLAIVSSPLYLFNVDNPGIEWANELALEHWCSDSIEELHQRDFEQGLTITLRQRLKHIQRNCQQHGAIVKEFWTVHPKGVTRSNPHTLSSFVDLSGRPLLLIEVGQPVNGTDMQYGFCSMALMHTSTMISAYDENFNLVYCNPAARQSIECHAYTLQQRLAHRSSMETIIEALQNQQALELELEVHSTSGNQWHAMQLQPCTSPQSSTAMLLISAHDITQRREEQQINYRLAYTDSLTDLPNRAALKNDLDALITQSLAKPEDNGFALYFLDLDRFKAINDSLGHAAGDQLLINVALRLIQSIGEKGSVYRLGGDEFVMLISGNHDNASQRKLAEHILHSMVEPITVSEQKVRILPSIGIASFPDDGISLGALLENADTAMYIAKSHQRGYCLYDHKMSSTISAAVRDRLELENDLNTAIDNQEFELYFQPKISCENFSVIGAEALIRWHHPTRGLVPPDTFIGIAEETGQIVELGNWVLREAMTQQRRWHMQGFSISVSVNISARQFSANDLLIHVSDALRETHCDAQMIELEITESILIGEPDAVHSTLHQLSAMGVRLALDDFGTGYSNLAYLQQYPLDSLKIDKIFLAEPRQSMLLGTILQMGRVLGLSVVAEGVETRTQADWLVANGCDALQGFYFSKPLPVSDATEFFEERGAPTNRHHKHHGRAA